MDSLSLEYNAAKVKFRFLLGRHRKTNNTWSYFDVESKKAELIGVESRMGGQWWRDEFNYDILQELL
jgi:hypothetical protein